MEYTQEELKKVLQTLYRVMVDYDMKHEVTQNYYENHETVEHWAEFLGAMEWCNVLFDEQKEGVQDHE